MREGKDEQQLEMLEAALQPPNKIDPLTGVPYGWDDDDAEDPSTW